MTSLLLKKFKTLYASGLNGIPAHPQGLHCKVVSRKEISTTRRQARIRSCAKPAKHVCMLALFHLVCLAFGGNIQEVEFSTGS